MPKKPRDPIPYARHPDSRPIGLDIPPGDYIYVQDVGGVIFVLPLRESHAKILGGASPARYAGELTLKAGGVVSHLNNLSGTFRFKRKGGLRAIAFLLRRRGFTVKKGAVVWFPPDGSSRPEILE